jgi:CopA family copper-resistance protein
VQKSIYPEYPPVNHSRRRFVLGASSALALSALPFSRGLWANPVRAEPAVLSGNEFNLDIGHQVVNFTGRERIATTVNQSLPAPLLRWREGERVRINVRNQLDTISSIHWHGLILPAEMDGVPGLSFDGIPPGETFRYEFDVKQSGTYWYHSHSGFQEQTGLYGAIIIDPREPDPVAYDREHTIVLSDWSDEQPEAILAKLKNESHYYNFRARTVGDFFADVKEKGLGQTWRDRAMWNQMRMSQTDLADVTGYTYTFLMNGITPDRGWQGLFKPGEKVRLRFINAAAMTVFDLRIPGLTMTVVAADGQDVQPVAVDEFRIGPAETYDVIVAPDREGAYTVFAQSIDRSGFARGSLSSRENLLGAVPPMDSAPVLTHTEMGMGHGASVNTGHAGGQSANGGHDAAVKDAPNHHHYHHAEPTHVAPAPAGLGRAGFGSHNEIKHADTEFGPQVDMRTERPRSGLHDPGIGLREHHTLGRCVLTYADLRSLHPTRDKRQPSREIQLHLTGNMHRYLWSMNGIPFADAEPLRLRYGERVRIVLVNDTMMTHPIHLHGMWSELETGDPHYIPRKHTVLVQPGSTISYLVTADARGRWAYHGHLLFHMAGMMREVRVA